MSANDDSVIKNYLSICALARKVLNLGFRLRVCNFSEFKRFLNVWAKRNGKLYPTLCAYTQLWQSYTTETFQFHLAL